MPGTVLDVFNGDAFNTLSLTDSINKMPFVPGKAGELGVFVEQGVPTTSVEIEEYNGTLNLIPTQQRGAPTNQNVHQKRKVRKLTVPHLPLEDTIRPDEIQNVRAFGSSDLLQGVQSVVDQRMLEMSSKHDATVEYGRIGALKGLLLDSDGATVIYNLFTEFGVTQQTQDLLTGTTTTDMIGKITDAAGMVEDELGAATYDHLHCFMGTTLWKAFISHTAVKDAYRYFQATGQNQNPLREDLRYAGFMFAGVIFEQYRGVVGGIPFIPVGEGYLHAVGVPNLFKTYYAPADFVETVNTMGLPRYAKQVVDPMLQRYVLIHTQSNPLSICTRPRTLIKLFSST